ncbi:hypothetical protein GCM10015536_08950 [Streptomyces griseomycini]|nr:hypothetical protein GCM10015536_08950 [Streptomyces griseomycini]
MSGAGPDLLRRHPVEVAHHLQVREVLQGEECLGAEPAGVQPDDGRMTAVSSPQWSSSTAPSPPATRPAGTQVTVPTGAPEGFGPAAGGAPPSSDGTLSSCRV